MSIVLDAAYRVVHSYPGGSASLAPRIGKNSTSLSHEVKRVGIAKFGLEDAVAVTVMTGDPSILNAFAAECGYLVLPMPQMASGDSTLAGLAEAAKEFGEFCSSVAEAAADGNVSANELGRVDRELSELIAKAQDVRARLAQVHEANVPAHVKANP